jgi:radical SAM protein with 4Fe4S-binding SPASM domain
MTKKCNADCIYCSSWQEHPLSYMSVKEFKKSIDYIVDYLMPLYGFDGRDPAAISIQYVGGEIATVPKKVLYPCVFYARDRFGEVFSNVTDGVQSNLIGSERRINSLVTLFGQNIGTSVDTLGRSRTVARSPEKYREILEKNIKLLNERRVIPGRIYVVDNEGLSNAEYEFRRAEKESYNLTFRPVFHGGKDVGAATPEELSFCLGNIFDKWIMKSNISIEPFHQLLNERLHEKTQDERLVFRFGCPFQNECAEVSLNLEPEGDLYICLDMADSDQFPLGNAVKNEFDEDLWERLNNRRHHLDNSCKSCDYLNSCQGGCMSEAIHSTKSMYGKTELCGLWKTIFSKIDENIERYGTEKVINWCLKVGQ